MRSRLITLIIVFCITSSILIGRLFYLQIVRGEDYLANYETQRLRFVADVYGQRTIDTLNEEQRNQSAADIIHYLCIDDVNGYGLDDSTLDPAYILKMVNMRYAMGLNSYQQYIATTLASDVSDETAAAIMENKDTLTGVDIAEDSLRRYTDGIYFASIIGYTGQISQDEYDALSDEDKKKYSLSDIVGKSGLEQTFDSVLQGTKGETTVYVDNLGKVTDTVSITEPEAGNDVYLTIDKDLQEYTYKLLEEKLAGIILSKLRNVINYDPANEASSTDIIIPVGDAYHSLIANSVVDATHFSSVDAKPAEQAVYAAFQAKKTDTLAQIMADMQSSTTAPYNQLSEEMQDYMDYIVDDVLKDYTGLLMTDKIDTSDETYTAWTRDETINVYTFLNYAITQNWIDTSKLESDSYSSSEEIYASLLNYLQDYLSEDSEFDKLLYEYLIKSGSISGAQICAILYEQGVLPMDEASYNGLLSGSVDAYSWLYGKIASLEITPGQLALEPCSAGAVVSDPNTGEVLACVSYPGYDNNRLANTMDSSYYRQLNTGLARTFYNRATQEKTAPGSTYKMVSSVAGLTEGIINGNTTFYCDGIFTNVTPSPRCWNRSGHGSLNVVRALQVSCNEFFYNVGYDLGLDANGNYDSDLGIEKLAKYASMFGLNEKSGVEIPESSPEISDQYAVQSAIGQGTNNYTVSQLNRYVAAVANRGTVYDLTLVDKTTDSSGKLIKEYEPEVVNTLAEVSSTTWDLVHEGMIRMVENSSTFTSLDMSIAGKTGTAQQSETSPDHALFVGFAPSDTPEIAIAVRIANGYNSSYPSEIGRDIVKIYFGLEDAEELVKGQAAELGQANAGD